MSVSLVSPPFHFSLPMRLIARRSAARRVPAVGLQSTRPAIGGAFKAAPESRQREAGAWTTAELDFIRGLREAGL